MKSTNNYKFKFRIRLRKNLYGFKSIKTDFVWEVFGNSDKECIKKLQYIYSILCLDQEIKGHYEEYIRLRFKHHLKSLNLKPLSLDFDFIIDKYHEGKWYIFSENIFDQEYFSERGEFIIP
jgi:hypothetical protein